MKYLVLLLVVAVVGWFVFRARPRPAPAHRCQAAGVAAGADRGLQPLWRASAPGGGRRRRSRAVLLPGAPPGRACTPGVAGRGHRAAIDGRAVLRGFVGCSVLPNRVYRPPLTPVTRFALKAKVQPQTRREADPAQDSLCATRAYTEMIPVQPPCNRTLSLHKRRAHSAISHRGFAGALLAFCVGSATPDSRGCDEGARPT